MGDGDQAHMNSWDDEEEDEQAVERHQSILETNLRKVFISGEKGKIFLSETVLQEDDQKQHALYALHVILLSNNTVTGQSKCTLNFFLYWFICTQISFFLNSGGKQKYVPHTLFPFLGDRNGDYWLLT